MKNLYAVKIEIEVLVLAESRKEARETAEGMWSEIRGNEEASFYAVEMSSMPNNWELDCLPYGHMQDEEYDRTVGGWIELGAAPRYAGPR